jgi:hypothetical protein
VSQNKSGSDELERYQHFPPAFAKASAWQAISDP